MMCYKTNTITVFKDKSVSFLKTNATKPQKNDNRRIHNDGNKRIHKHLRINETHKNERVMIGHVAILSYNVGRIHLCDTDKTIHKLLDPNVLPRSHK